MESIGEKIYNLRKEKGVSQEALALELGVARQTVSKWEMNATQPTLENVEGMCAFFGVSATCFFGSGEETAVSNSDGQLSAKSQVKKEKFKTLKIVLSVVGAVSLVLCVVFGLMAFFDVITPSEKYFIFEFVPITFLIVGIIVASIPVTLLVLFIKKRRKK